MHLWEDYYILEILNPKLFLPHLRGSRRNSSHYYLSGCYSPYSLPNWRFSFSPGGTLPCGRTHRRISRIQGRTDDMFIFRGVNIFPMQIEKVLMSNPEVGNNYRIILEREDYRDKMIVEVEIKPELFLGDLQKLARLRERIQSELHSEILVTPEVILVEQGVYLPRKEKFKE